MGNLSYLQPMGTAGKLIRIMIILLIGIIAWRLWYYVFTTNPATIPTVVKENILDNTGIHAVPHQTEKLEPLGRGRGAPLRIAVYYEALCPDSKDFVARQLVPTYKAMNDVITVDLIPYGKATSRITAEGRKVFTCQHGPKECAANTVHACVSKHILDEGTRLQVVKCMIENNRQMKEPLEVGRQCFSTFQEEDFDSIEKCSEGEEGEELLFHLGKMTDDLIPRARFIPTITINDSQKNQPLILRDLKKALCNFYKGFRHSACTA